MGGPPDIYPIMTRVQRSEAPKLQDRTYWILVKHKGLIWLYDIRGSVWGLWSLVPYYEPVRRPNNIVNNSHSFRFEASRGLGFKDWGLGFKHEIANKKGIFLEDADLFGYFRVTSSGLLLRNLA